MSETETLLAWHFLPDNGRMRYGDGRKVEVGQTYSLPAGWNPVMCQAGFHASVNPLDALRYAPGSLCCRVELSGTVIVGDDKCVASTRRVLWMADATRTLHLFAVHVASDALDLVESRGGTVDPRSRAGLQAKLDWLGGKISDEELDSASYASHDAASDASYADYDASYAAAYAASDAADDAADAASHAASYAASAASYAASHAASYAAAAASYAASYAAYYAKQRFSAELTQRLEALNK